MSKNDGYSGGSTVVRLGTSWFSHPQPDVDPESGETREERRRRLAAEAKRRAEKKDKQAKKKKRPSLNLSTKRAKRNEQRRLERVAKNRARLAEQEAGSPSEPRQSDVQQQERMSKVIIEVKHKRSVATSKK